VAYCGSASGLLGALDRWDDLAVKERTGHTIERSPAALALENERLQRALRARLSEEAALRRVATLVARQHAPEEVFTVVAEEVARHLDADAAITVRYDAPGAQQEPADAGDQGSDSGSCPGEREQETESGSGAVAPSEGERSNPVPAPGPGGGDSAGSGDAATVQPTPGPRPSARRTARSRAVPRRRVSS
jgi:hypothetical protein